MRIRTLKPEWLDDERMLEAGSDARVLSVSLILLADDYGNGRANAVALANRVFPLDENPLVKFRGASEKLLGWYAAFYLVDGQRYFHIRNWDRHQRVDKPGKPRVPGPEKATDTDASEMPNKVREAPAKNIVTLAPDHDHDHDHEGDHDARGERGANGSVEPEDIVAVYREVTGKTDFLDPPSWSSRQREAGSNMLRWARANGGIDALRTQLIGIRDREKDRDWIIGQPVHVWAERVGTVVAGRTPGEVIPPYLLPFKE